MQSTTRTSRLAFFALLSLVTSVTAGNASHELSRGPWRPTVLAPIVDPAAVYDEGRRRMILIGGVTKDDIALSEIWTLEPSGDQAWERMIDAECLNGSQFASATYDPVRDRVIVFGGYHRQNADIVGLVCTSTSDLRVLELAGTARVTDLPRSQGPPARHLHSAIYDPLRDRLLVYGGVRASGGQSGCGGIIERFSDVWELSLAENPHWTELHPSGVPPPPGLAGSATYDSMRDRMLFFAEGGLWALSLDSSSGWSEVETTGAAPPGSGRIFHDRNQDRLLFSDGLRLWALPFDSLSWSRLAPMGSPPGHVRSMAFVFDPAGRLITCGEDAQGSLTTYEATAEAPNWRPLAGDARHPPAEYRTAYDSSRGRLLIHEDANGGIDPRQVWALALSGGREWRLLETAGPTPPRAVGHSIVYDALGDRLLGLLPILGTPLRNELWALDFSGTATWSALQPSGTLPPRRYHTAVRDPIQRGMLVFGGYGDGVVRNDLWCLNLDGEPTWVELEAEGTPPSPRYGHAAAYDSFRKRMIVVGGFGPATGVLHQEPFQRLTDVHALELGGTPRPRWVQIRGNDGPWWNSPDPPAAIIDEIGDRLIVVVSKGAWSLPLSRLWGWEQLQQISPGFETPPGCPATNPFELASAAFDPLGGRMILTGGFVSSLLGFGRDTWDFDLGTPTTPALISLVRTSASPELITVEWQVSQSSPVQVFRRTAATSWASRGSLIPDGRGHVRFEDHDVEPGGRYGYAIVLADQEAPAGEVWVDVPRISANTLLEVRPNPGSGPLTVTFELAGSSATRLSIVDVTGREIAARQVGGFGEGIHQLRWSETEGLAPGVFFVRLVDARGTRQLKTVVVR